MFRTQQNGCETELQNTESVADTQNLIRDVSCKTVIYAETLLIDRSDETKTPIRPHSSTVHTTTENKRKVKPPDRYTPGTSSNVSYDLGSSDFSEIERLAYHSDNVDQELPKSIKETFSPEWHRTNRKTNLYRKMKCGNLLKCPKNKTS